MKNTLLLSLFLFVNLVSITLADGDDNKPVQTLQNVTVPDTEIAGIATIRVKPTSYQEEFTAYGKVVNIQPLLELRNRYFVALTDLSSAQAKFNQSEQNNKRQQALYSSGVGSKHTLQTGEAQWQIDKVQLDAANFQLQTLKSEALLLWGEKLTAEIFAKNSDNFTRFLTGNQKLLQITLPSNQQLPDNIKAIAIEASANRTNAQQATFISPAPLINNTDQGASYFFSLHNKTLRPGMAINAWIPRQNAVQEGVIIPKSAVIWAMGQAFVYIKISENQFTRRVIESYTSTPDGYFIGDAIKANEEIVIVGGQTLFSEQLRGQIPAEND